MDGIGRATRKRRKDGTVRDLREDVGGKEEENHKRVG